MRTRKLFLSILSLFCMGSFTYAQEPKLVAAKLDSLPEIIRYYLQETTSKHFEDPRVPRFLLKDRSDNFVFGVGGSIEGKLFYDHEGNRTAAFKMLKSDNQPIYDNDVIDFRMNTSNIVFKFLGKTKAGVIDGLINVNFNNAKDGILLLDAYLDVFGFRIGKTNTCFRDDESMKMVDAFGILSGTARKIPQIGYSYKFKNGLRTQVGVEFPQSVSVWLKETATDRAITSINILLPDVAAGLYYNKDRIHLYAGADFRMVNYYDENVRFKPVPTYAGQLGMNWSFIKRKDQTHKLYLQAFGSHGMADCCNSLRDQGLSAVVDLQSATYKVPDIFAGSCGYQAAFGKNTIGVSASTNYVSNHEAMDIGQMYSWAWAATINYFRTFFTYGTFGLEAIAGSRRDLDNNSYSNIRTYLFIRYNF